MDDFPSNLTHWTTAQTSSSGVQLSQNGSVVPFSSSITASVDLTFPYAMNSRLRRLFGARRSVQRDGDGGGGVRAIGASGNSDWGEPAIRIRREKLGKGRRESAPLPCFVRPCCLGGELDLHYQQVRRTGTFDKRLIFCDRPAVS